MQATFAYARSSAVVGDRSHQTLRLEPNLAREPVSFDAPLLKPLRFREAISALHDVVISDLRFKKRDKTAYRQWLESERKRLADVRGAALTRLREQAQTKVAVPADFERQYKSLNNRYWTARKQYSDYLYKHDPLLWRKLLPCDPVCTVAEDVVFFECFSADESSYGCLSIDRDGALGRSDSVKLGTTNVDYSLDLYHHFQSLRSYRETRLSLDPDSFSVKTQEAGDHREEKIDLPTSWLKGFMQLQSAMTLPLIRVPLSKEAVYSILAYLRRHKARTSPRALRFDLSPGQPPKVTLEPWGQSVVSHGTTYQGRGTEPLRIWGRQRLLSLARVLPLAESFEVCLLGTGLPSFWIAHMGEMRLTLGLSGWTSNDWTRASAIDLIAPPTKATPEQVSGISNYLMHDRKATLAQVAARRDIDEATAAAALRRLAHVGQVIHDLPKGVFRFRQIMPEILGEAQLGPEHPELAGAREIMARKPVKIETLSEAPNNGFVVSGTIDGHPVELLVDGDKNVRRGKCDCSYYYRFGLRNGPCRHMITLRRLASMKAGVMV
jgi:hypothetical protein